MDVTQDEAAAPWITRQLRPLMAHAGPWLLAGPSSLGQFDLALALARAWLCDRPTDAGACGTCASCHEIGVHTHPDLLVLMPDAEREVRGWPLPESAAGSADTKKNKLSRDIRIDQMRAAVEFAQRTSSRGRGRVILVHPAERMNAVTANALLKTLEEPPGDVRFVLSTGAGHLLLPTIRSRCLAHTMVWPDAAEAAAWLGQQGDSGTSTALAWRAAGGRPGEALRLLANAQTLAHYAQFPAQVKRGDGAALAGLALAEAIERMQKLCHDLMLQHVGAPPRFFTLDELRDVAPSAWGLARWWAQLGQMARSAQHPLNPELSAEFLLSISQQALN